jgi:CRISPR-associated protein Cas1
MAGVDGVSLSRFRRAGAACLRHLQARMARLEYRPSPLRLMEVEKRKSAGGQNRRLLLVPTVLDRVVQTAAASWLAARWNPDFDDSSYAYRPGLGVADALRALASLRDRKFCWILDADIRAFLDAASYCPLVHESCSNSAGC